MIIKEICLKEGFIEKRLKLIDGINLIHSKKNSVGKTTLIRMILYGLGYNIPNTKNIRFEKCEVELLINVEKVGEIKLHRYDITFIQAEINNQIRTYVLPEEQNEVHKMIFNIDRDEVVRNLLGVYYVDQEKGWTLLNRGIVIGSNHFSIENLILGLSDINCNDLLRRKIKLKKEKNKLQQMSSAIKYKEEIENEKGIIGTETYEEELDITLDELLIKQRELKKELRRIDYTLSGNKKFKEFVAEMKLIIKLPDGSSMAVTEDDIIGLNDAISLLVAKKKYITMELSNIISRINSYKNEYEKEVEQVAFFDTIGQIEFFDKKIVRIPINHIVVEKEIQKLSKEYNIVRDDINRLIKNSKVSLIIYEKMMKYAVELGLGNKETMPVSYLFTSNLKELSGAVLHKTVFAFRLGYILAIEEILGIKLPIILDSPSGKEVDHDNINKMMSILNRDFSDHQIIIASIFEYNIDNVNTIEINEQLIDL